MKTRFAVGLILLGILVGCSKTVTGPDLTHSAPAPAATPATAPEPTPTAGPCRPVSSCHPQK